MSTDKDEQLRSLKNQQDYYLQFAKENNYRLVRIYSDEGISGKQIRDRREFLKMIEEGERGEFDILAVKDVSRFARNTCDFLTGIRRLKSAGIDVRFLGTGSSVMTDSEFILTIYAALAQQESENLSKRVIFGKTENARKGRVPNLIYGYDKVDNFTLIVNQNEGYNVYKVFELYTEELYSLTQIAAEFNLTDIPTKLGGRWSAKTLSRIIRNPIYVGRLINHKTTTADFLSGTRRALPESDQFVHIRPELRIVSDEVFERANAILRDTSRGR